MEEVIEENHENLHNFNQVDELVEKWNNLYDEYFGDDNHE